MVQFLEFTCDVVGHLLDVDAALLHPVRVLAHGSIDAADLLTAVMLDQADCSLLGFVSGGGKQQGSAAPGIEQLQAGPCTPGSIFRGHHRRYRWSSWWLVRQVLVRYLVLTSRIP